ncbi:MAG: hypothetical protein OEV64_01875 [Desulfobulbaceae bacterium]|nr:hypothetical protein [Desulfobulbaceae bacterium]
MTKETWIMLIAITIQTVLSVLIGYWQVTTAKQMANPAVNPQKYKVSLLDKMALYLSKNPLHIKLPPLAYLALIIYLKFVLKLDLLAFGLFCVGAVSSIQLTVAHYFLKAICNIMELLGKLASTNAVLAERVRQHDEILFPSKKEEG